MLLLGAAGLLLAAISVRMVAGNAAAMLNLLAQALLMWWVPVQPAVFFGTTLLVAVLLRFSRSFAVAVLALVMAGGGAAALHFGVGQPVEASHPLLLVLLAALAAFWTIQGLRERDASVVMVAGLPVTAALWDAGTATVLLVSPAVCLAALFWRSYRLKRLA